MCVCVCGGVHVHMCTYMCICAHTRVHMFMYMHVCASFHCLSGLLTVTTPQVSLGAEQEPGLRAAGTQILL